MRAIVQGAYGSTDVLELREIERPVPRDNEVLVRVHAAGVGPDVWHLMAGEPYMVRLAVGLRRPRRPGPGLGRRRACRGGRREGDAVLTR